MNNKTFTTSATIINIFVTIMFMCMFFLPLGCGHKIDKEKQVSSSYTVTDSTGVKIDFAKKPERIISMSISTDEILIDMVDSKRIVGFSRLVDVPGISNVIDRAKAVEGRVYSGNSENIIPLRPDLVIAPSFTPIELIQTLRDMGIKVYLYRTPHTLNDIKATIREFAAVVDEKAKAEEIISKMDEKLAYVKSKTGNIGFSDQKRVILMDNNGSFYMPNSSFSNLCRNAGARDATQELGYEKNCILSQEEIVRLNPDIFVLSDWNYDGKHDTSSMKQELVTNPSYQTTKAGKNKAVISISAARLLSLSQYTADAVVDLAKSIYPERF